MARAIWKGSISFGLVNIPIALYPATRREELKFRLLRKSDLSPVNYKRVAEKDGKEVSWDEIVKGYEYEKGKYVVLKDEDFERVDLEATQTVDIQDFVDQAEIDLMFFYKPYYLEPQKGGDKAFVLLREALKSEKKIGIAKVVIKTRPLAFRTASSRSSDSPTALTPGKLLRDDDRVEHENRVAVLQLLELRREPVRARELLDHFALLFGQDFGCDLIDAEALGDG